MSGEDLAERFGRWFSKQGMDLPDWMGEVHFELARIQGIEADFDNATDAAWVEGYQRGREHSDKDVLRLRAALAETDRLRAVLRDFAEHGLRHDLNPTMRNVNATGVRVYAWFSEYMKGADAQVRERARRALDTDQ